MKGYVQNKETDAQISRNHKNLFLVYKNFCTLKKKFTIQQIPVQKNSPSKVTCINLKISKLSSQYSEIPPNTFHQSSSHTQNHPISPRSGKPSSILSTHIIQPFSLPLESRSRLGCARQNLNTAPICIYFLTTRRYAR